MTRRRTWLLLAAAVMAAQVIGCRSSPSDVGPSGDRGPAPAKPHPVVLMGLDGLEWDVVLDMLRAGRLPALAGLMRQGVFGELETFIPTWSPAIWTSIVTGKVPSKHGITGFVHSADEKGVRRLYTNRDRRSKAIWNILTDSGRGVAAIGWWMTFPVEEINGVMVAQVNTTTPDAQRGGEGVWKGGLVESLRGQVHPPERQPEILSIMRAVEGELPELTKRVFGDLTFGLCALPRRLWESCMWAFRADAVYHRIGRELLAPVGTFDLFAIYFGGSDVVGHRFWRYAYPDLYERRPTDQEIDDLGHLLSDYYAYLDTVVAEFIRAAPAETVFMVVSDHGMVPVNKAGSFPADGPPKAVKSGGHGKAPPGIFIAAGPGIRRSKLPKTIEDLAREDLITLGSVLDVTPTLLALLGLPVGRDMDGRVMRGIIEPTYLAEHPVEYVRSHDPWLAFDTAWFGQDSSVSHEGAEELERLEQLRALGYIQ